MGYVGRCSEECLVEMICLEVLDAEESGLNGVQSYTTPMPKAIRITQLQNGTRIPAYEPHAQSLESVNWAMTPFKESQLHVALIGG